VESTPTRVGMHRKPTAEEYAVTRAALNDLITALGLRPGDDTRSPERGALARLAEAVGVSEQRMRVAYMGVVAVRPDTLTRWAEAVRSGQPSAPDADDTPTPEEAEQAGSDAE
jgi:hypothetical protein